MQGRRFRIRSVGGDSEGPLEREEICARIRDGRISLDAFVAEGSTERYLPITQYAIFESEFEARFGIAHQSSPRDGGHTPSLIRARAPTLGTDAPQDPDTLPVPPENRVPAERFESDDIIFTRPGLPPIMDDAPADPATPATPAAAPPGAEAPAMNEALLRIEHVSAPPVSGAAEMASPTDHPARRVDPSRSPPRGDAPEPKTPITMRSIQAEPEGMGMGISRGAALTIAAAALALAALLYAASS